MARRHLMKRTYLGILNLRCPMNPIRIEPLSEKAYELLRQLEELQILRVLPDVEPAAPAPIRRRWAGALSDEATNHLRKHTEQTRQEWERTF